MVPRAPIGLLLAASITAAAGERTRLALVPITHSGVEAELIPSLTAVLSVELERTGRFAVLSMRDVDSMLVLEEQRDRVGCDETCLTEIGGALGADHVVAAHLGRVGQAYVLDVSLIDVRRAQSEGRAYASVEGPPEALLGVVHGAVADLLRRRELPASLPAAAVEPLPAPSSAPARRYAWAVAGVGVAMMISGGILRDQNSAGLGDVALWTGAASTAVGLVLLGVP